MKQKFYHSYKSDDMLKYISLLSVRSCNSPFMLRIFKAQMTAYGMWRRGKYDWNKIEKILINGIPTLEDPQERLFVETVNTPYGSFSVFSSVFLTHKSILSQLLYMADNLGISRDRLGLVYAILEMSDIIAGRLYYARNDIGSPAADELSFGTYASFVADKNATVFGTTEFAEILAKYNLSVDDVQFLFLDKRAKELEKDALYDGNSDIFEIHPFIRLKSGEVLVSIPSFLLRTAYKLSCQIIKSILGTDALLDFVEKEMIQEVGMVVEKNHANFLQKIDAKGVPCLWFRFDKDKIANVVLFLADKRTKVNDAIVESEAQIEQSYPGSTVLTLLITQQLDERNPGIPLTKRVTVFTIEELKIALSRDRMDLLNLYYYDRDRSALRMMPTFQEIDTFAYYYDKGCTFYQEVMPTYLVVEIGNALSMRSDYLEGLDEHVVRYEPTKSSALVKHYSDIPKQVPIYVPYMTVKHVYMLQLKDCEMWIHIGADDKFCKILREFVIASFNWFYALELRRGINPLTKTVYVELTMMAGGKFQHRVLSDNVIAFTIPVEILEGDPATIEYQVVSELMLALKSEGYLSGNFTDTILQEMMQEAGTGFVQVGNKSDANILDINDGVTSCHYVNKRYSDVILSEIADNLNMKGSEQKFTIADSKNVMIKVSDFLLAEVLKIIQKIDTGVLLKSLLNLHHAMIYWSKLTQRRYDGLSRAYAYIDATFDNQFDYVNEYSEMNTLTQGLIESIIINDVHNSGGEPDIESLDRLFALVHEILTVGIYMDQLSAKIPGSELTILANGRIVMPKPLIDRLNNYFYSLRDISMTQPDLFAQYSNLVSESVLDPDSEQFLSAFKAEYEIGFDQYCKMINTSIDYATLKQSPLMIMSEKDFVDIIAKDIIDENEFMLFKKHFVLDSSLQDAGLQYSDKWLQRFNRPIQITARPWILFEGNIYYSTKTIYESWMVKCERLSNGSIVANSDQMKQFVAQINNDKGHVFAKGVAEYYQNMANSGVLVFKEVPIKPDKPLKAHKDLGDIDILLINEDSKQIVCIEAKNFIESRTAYELIQQNRKIETKELKHVIERDGWCKKNVELFKFYDSQIDSEYSVKTIFLTYHENAYKYFDHAKAADIVFMSGIDIIRNPMAVFES